MKQTTHRQNTKGTGLREASTRVSIITVGSTRQAVQDSPKTGPLVKCIMPIRDDTVSYIKIQSKTGILNITTFKYSLRKFRETVLH